MTVVSGSDPELLERDELLASLEARLDRAAGAEGSVALVAGEAGAGKSTLVSVLAARAGRRALVLEGGCDPLSTPRPLGPLYDIASTRDSGLEEILHSDREPYAIFAMVLERIRHSIRPVLVVLEDLHWSDEATLDFVRFIGRRVGGSKALVVLTYRDDEVGPEHPMRTVIGQLLRLPTTTRFHVPPLSERAVAQLAAGRALDAHRLHEMTGGNAFFVTEVIAAGGRLPETVQAAVLARVSRLRDTPRRVVEAVSIAPRSLEIDRVASLVEAGVADVDEAIGSGVVLGDRALLRFRHELARAAVEESLPHTRRLDLHRRMLASLIDEESPDPSRLTHHAIRAEAAELVVEHAPRAAADAARRGAHKEAVSFYEAALRTDLLPPDAAAELRLELALELRLVDRQLESMKEAERAAAFFRDVGDVRLLARSLSALSTVQWRTHDIGGARRSVDEAVDLLRPLGPSPDLAFALQESGYFHMLARHAEPAFEAAGQAMEMAEAAGSREVALAVKLLLGTIELVVGEPHRGALLLREVHGEAERAGDERTVNLSLSMLGSGGGEARLYAEALRALSQGVELGLATDQDYMVDYERSWLARIAFEQGRWDEAATHAEQVVANSPNETGIAVVTARGALGRVRVRRGDPRGREVLEQVLAVADLHEIQHVWSPMSGLAEHRWLSGRREDMEPVLTDGYRRALDTDSPWARGELGFWMWKAGAIDRPPDGAAEPFALQMRGDWRGAAEAWGVIGCPYEVALALLDGDGDAVLEAVAEFDALGARPAASLARARLRELGIESIPRRPTEETRANPAGLTTRQLEVLQLLAAGLSNAEIAQQLFISMKTVEHHASAVYAKLGVATRTRAVAAARELGVIEDRPGDDGPTTK